jgi:hypothetical protein
MFKLIEPMMKIFTFQFYLKKMWGKHESAETSLFIKKGLAEKFEPNEQSIKNILAFSDAYRHEKTASIGSVEYLMN